MFPHVAVVAALFLASAMRAQSADPNFNLSVSGPVYSVAIQTSGKILIGGGFYKFADQIQAGLGRLNSNGTPDPAFAPGLDGVVRCLVIQPDGKILVGGQFTMAGGRSRNRIARLNPDGSLDLSFDPGLGVNGESGTYPEIRRLAIQADGKILLGGEFDSIAGQPRNHIARLNADGSLDATFNPNPTGLLSPGAAPGLFCLAVQRDQKILFGGQFTVVAGQIRNGFARVNSDGSLDSTFNPATRAATYSALVIEPDDRILIGGSFSEIAGSPQHYLARLNPDGSLAAGFRPVLDGPISALAEESDGLILIGGYFFLAGGQLRGSFARLTNSGLVDNTFDPKLSTPASSGLAPISVLFPQADGGIFVGGSFTALGGQSCTNFAYLKPAAPLIVTQPFSQLVTSGATVTLRTSVALSGTAHSYQWRKNGNVLAGETASSLTIGAAQPSDAGIYTASISNSAGLAVATEPAVLGVSITGKTAGAATEIAANSIHANGNTYDQVLLQGTAASITADLGQITRLSFIDLSDDIVQVEFSGAGTLSVTLSNVSAPAAPLNYNQSVTYMKGHATIVIAGANETTHVSVFSVGRITAIDQSLFKNSVTYDGLADIACVAILSANGKFGGVRTSNANYLNTTGLTGIYAPGVRFSGPVYAGDINASDAAAPVFVLGSCSDTRITGGDLLQANGRAVQVKGLTQLRFTDGSTSHGSLVRAKLNRGRLEQDGADVTSLVVLNPGP